LNWGIDKVRKEILTADYRFKVLVCGRRWGKTNLALIWLSLGEMKPDEQRWFIAPTYKQGKMIAFPILRQAFRDRARINESELKVTFPNDSAICIKGADNEDSLRGAGLGMDGGNAVVLDEYAYFKPYVWEEIILPMLATSEGSAMFIGTPNGYNAMYDLYMKGQADPDWMSWQFKTSDGGFVSDEEIKQLKGNMDGRLYRQEMEGSFETTGNRAAYNFDRDKHLVSEADKSQMVYAGLDQNVDYMTAVKVFEYTDQTIHYEDEIRLSNSNTEEMAKEIKRRWTDVKQIFPDPAGSARSTTSHRSDHQILREHGYQVTARRAHPSHRDRLNALNRKLLSADGKTGMTINPRCKYLIKDLEQVQRDKKGGIDKSNIELTHALDACSYLIEYKFPVIKRIATSYQW
tara:strand:+ start:842 stop:2053 length:1212 start_codon:yes stop_codon:yes gene_type:complete